MRTIAWSGRSLTQLKSAVDYLAARDLGGAQKLERQILDTIIGLARRPIGRPGHRPGTYEKIVPGTRYVIVYTLGEGALGVTRIFHMSQDWTSWSSGADEGD